LHFFADALVDVAAFLVLGNSCQHRIASSSTSDMLEILREKRSG
jgi:hypothetical protein